jgi:predicted regulator of Ras-like GTPase activity (Roadblock/LC7/MglB family)
VRQLLDEVVDQVDALRGAVLASLDGFVLAARVPHAASIDAAGLAAMSAAAMALGTRLVQVTGTLPASLGSFRSGDAAVFVFGVGDRGVLTLLADGGVDATSVEPIGVELAAGLGRVALPFGET